MFGTKWHGSNEDKWRDFEKEALPYRADLFRTAMWMTRDRDAAEDLVQETMFQAIRSFHLYELGTNCKAWLMRILYVHNVRRIRSTSKLQLVQDVDDEMINSVAFVAPIPQKITDEEVLEAIWRVPEHFRSVLVLADIEEMSYKDISMAMDIPLGTVMSRLSRGRRILRQELAEYAEKAGFAGGRLAAGE